MQAPPLSRWLGFTGLCAGVLALHLWWLTDPFGLPLATGVSQGRPPASLQVRLLAPPRPAEVPPTAALAARPAPAPAPAPLDAARTTEPAPEPAPVPPLRLPATPPAPPAADGLLRPDEPQAEPSAPSPSVQDGGPPPSPAPAPPSAVAEPAAAPGFVTMAQRAAGRVASVPPAPGAPEAAPEVAASLPAEAVTWQYRAQRGAGQGTATLTWRPGEGQRYSATLQVWLDGRTWLDWGSEGERTAAGLAPERMVERIRDKVAHAVNFQRDKGIVSYAGPTRTDPLPDGAQDRLSWLVQLPALVRARGGVMPGDRLAVPVAGPRGTLDVWWFEVQPTEVRTVSGLMLPLVRLLREPARPYDLRVMVWLAPSFDQMPVGVAWGVEPGGEPLSLWRHSLPVPR